MKKTACAIAAAMLALGLTAAPLRAQAQTRSVWDGIFSTEQAGDGKDLYGAKCALCHGEALAGKNKTPALAGDAFLEKWSGQTLDALAIRIQTTMPVADPGSLSNKQMSDLVSYILSCNQFPAGDRLPNNPALMAPITILAVKPAAP